MELWRAFIDLYDLFNMDEKSIKHHINEYTKKYGINNEVIYPYINYMYPFDIMDNMLAKCKRRKKGGVIEYYDDNRNTLFSIDTKEGMFKHTIGVIGTELRLAYGIDISSYEGDIIAKWLRSRYKSNTIRHAPALWVYFQPTKKITTQIENLNQSVDVAKNTIYLFYQNL